MPLKVDHQDYYLKLFGFINYLLLIDRYQKWSMSCGDQKFDCNYCKALEPEEDEAYQTIRIVRITTICISVAALVLNIILIIKKKQYRFTTIKLFLFVLIFYVFSLMSVVPHDNSFNLNQIKRFQNETICSFENFTNCLAKQNESYKNAIQGFINLTSYAISYWFAVCITLYIRHVLEENHKHFMRKNKYLIFGIIGIIVFWYLIPFILTFLCNVLFSFGPTGYRFDNNNDYFFYSGIVAREQGGQWIVALWMFMIPMSLFSYHLFLYLKNKQFINRLEQLDDFTSKQWFIIRLNRLSFYIFSVQFVNLFKSIIGFYSDASTALAIIVFIINSLFDFMALVLICIYFKYYYKEGRNLHQNSEIMIEDDAQSHGNLSSNFG